MVAYKHEKHELARWSDRVIDINLATEQQSMAMFKVKELKSLLAVTVIWPVFDSKEAKKPL